LINWKTIGDNYLVVFENTGWGCERYLSKYSQTGWGYLSWRDRYLFNALYEDEGSGFRCYTKGIRPPKNIVSSGSKFGLIKILFYGDS
jgi:hypothetical protein